ncbi:hypothetical protein LINGRAHAP2_LOCUS7468 [Linum grandiflorum]
MWCFS